MKSILLSFALLMLSTSVYADSKTVNVGQKVVISVSADGSQPFTYQWMKNGVNIAGATLSTYTINSAALSDGATYTAKVSNSAGSTTSDNAVLTVVQAGVPPTNASTSITIVVTP